MIIISLCKSRDSRGTVGITVVIGTEWIDNDVRFDSSATTLSLRKLGKTRKITSDIMGNRAGLDALIVKKIQHSVP
jgi:hypothetical protein